VRGLRSVKGDAETADTIVAHMENHVGPVDHVFHEIVSELVHVDVHVVAPAPGRDYYTLFTTGMSEHPMTVPDAGSDPPFAELMIALPRTWKLTQADFKDERNYWPIRWLKVLARMPHRYATWLAWGHTIPNGDPPEPFAPDTRMCSILITPPLLLDHDATHVTLPERTITLYALVPLHMEELQLKLDRGLDKLETLLDAHGVTELLDPQRSNVVTTPAPS
jgi:hypothetical protein